MAQFFSQSIQLSILALAVSSSVTLTTNIRDSVLAYSITSQESLVVIGFEGQEEERDYIFCRLPNCNCEDMISKGPRSHPQLNSVQMTANIQCQDSNTMTFERFDNGFKPYIWNNKKSEDKPQQPETTNRIAQATTTTDTVPYTDTDMTALITVGSELVIKWKFNTDNTIEMCLCLNKKAWIGIGFGEGMKGVDMFAVNIIDGVPEVLDLYSTNESTPPIDTVSNIELISYSISDSAFNVRVKRALSTGDTAQDKILTKGNTYTWSYASSSSQFMEDHKNDYQEFEIKLVESGAQTTSFGSLFSLMTISIAISLMY